jgi:hypothetical protein
LTHDKSLIGNVVPRWCVSWASKNCGERSDLTKGARRHGARVASAGDRAFGKICRVIWRKGSRLGVVFDSLSDA